MLTAIVIAKNEAASLPDCLSSLRFCDRIVVIDDHSSDSTVQVAKKFGAEVLPHPLNGDFSAQRNWAAEHIKSPWLLYVDADEQVSPQLAADITQAVASPDSTKGFYISRVDFMWGWKLTRGDLSHVWLLRLARRGAGRWHGKVHETWTVPGRTRRLAGELWHRPHPDLYHFLSHLNHYSSLRAQELEESGIRANLSQVIIYPLVKFTHLWIIKLGFLDGTAGFIHAAAMAFYTFLVRGKLYLHE